jgi:ketosteroid isomerase-like protein
VWNRAPAIDMPRIFAAPGGQRARSVRQFSTGSKPTPGVASDHQPPDHMAKIMALFVAAGVAAVAIMVVYWTYFAAAPQFNAADPGIQRAVLAAHDRMIAAAEARNPDALLSDVAPNDRGALIVDGRLLLKRDDVVKQTRDNFSRIAALKYTFQERHVTLLSPTAALLVATGRAEGRTEDGRNFGANFGHTYVLTLEQGHWRVLHSHQSSVR